MAIPVNAVKSSKSNSSVGSATGNPRNKVALLPGYSLMDWIRLGNSGKDLTSVGGILQDVTEEQLKQHNQQENAWLSIRETIGIPVQDPDSNGFIPKFQKLIVSGKVYNIAPYMNFHPGGVQELMKGAGKDATSLFTEIHPWVNYESILQKCLVGRLVRTKNPATSFDFKKAFFPNSVSSKEDTKKETEDDGDEKCKGESLYDSDIKMCWCQSPTAIKFVFLSKSSSPHLVVKMLPEYRVRILIRVKKKLHVFGFQLENKVYWPCDVTVNTESGRIEIEFPKKTEGFWDKYGVDDKDNAIVASSVDEIETYHRAKIISIEQVTHNVRTFILKFVEKVFMWVPIGHDIRIRATIAEMECAKQYTPIPPYLPHGEPVKHWHNDYLCCMVKYYEEGALTPYLFSKKEGDTIEIGGIGGSFNLCKLNEVQRLYLIAAGSGLSPMLKLLVWAKSRKDKLKNLHLLSVNRYEKDIIWRDKLDEFAAREKWFKVTYCLSQPESDWDGLTGRVDEEILNNFLPDVSPFSKEQPDFYVCACGPIQFTEMIQEHLNRRGYTSCSHCFLG